MKDDTATRLSSSRKRAAILDKLPADVRKRLQDELESDNDERELVAALTRGHK